MALKKTDTIEKEESLSEKKAKEVFSQTEGRRKKEKMVMSTFSISPTFKAELEDLFGDMGLGWASGIRFALKEFYNKYHQE